MSLVQSSLTYALVRSVDVNLADRRLPVHVDSLTLECPSHESNFKATRIGHAEPFTSATDNLLVAQVQMTVISRKDCPWPDQVRSIAECVDRYALGLVDDGVRRYSYTRVC